MSFGDNPESCFREVTSEVPRSTLWGSLWKLDAALQLELWGQEDRGTLEADSEACSSVFGCLHASVLSCLCSHCQVSQFTADILLMLLPLLFSHLYNTCQLIGGIANIFTISLIFSISLKKQLGVKSG